MRDHVLAAIDGGVLGNLEDGLAMYQRLIDAVILLRAQHESEYGFPGPAFWTTKYGQEMAWLEEDLSTFLIRAFEKPATPVLDRLIRFMVALLHSMKDADQLEAHRQVLRLAAQFYRASLGSPESGADSRPGRRLLRAIRSYLEYDLRVGVGSAGDASVQYANQVIAFLISCAKTAVDLSSAELFGATVEIKMLAETLVHREGRTQLLVGRAPMESAMSHLGGFVVGLVAYVLLKSDQQDAPQHQSMQTTQAANLLDDYMLPFALPAVLDEGGVFPWSSWEADLWRDGQTSGFLGRLQDWMRRVVVIEAAKRGSSTELRAQLDPGAASPVGVDAEYQVELLAEAARKVCEIGWLQDQYPDFPGQERLLALARELDGVAHHLGERAKDERSARPMEVPKVMSFASAVERVWTSGSPLRGDIPAIPDASEPPEEWLAYTQLVPKEFFIESEVFADAADFGREVAAAMVRGELRAVFESLAGLPTTIVEPGAIRESVADAILELRRSGYNPSVVVLDSWAVMHALTGRGGRSRDQQVDFKGALVSLEYLGGEDACLVLDAPQGLEIRRWAAQPADEDFLLLAEGQLHVSVRDVTIDLAEQFIVANPGLLEGDDGDVLDRSTTVRRLTRSSHVRVQTKFDVAVRDPSAIRILAVAAE